MIEGIMQLFYPHKCVICRGILPRHSTELICDSCRHKVRPITEPRCKRCSKPCFEMEQEFCGDCSEKNFEVESGYALYLYDNHMQRAVQNFKYHGVLACGDHFAKELCDNYGGWLRSLSPDVLIPVPIHKKRLRFRGFNQAQYLAERVGARCSIPVRSDYLVRTEDTLPQKVLDHRGRIKNLKKSFAVFDSGDIKYKKIVLVDDIYTTGATLEACAYALKKAGAKKIYFLCLCIGCGDEV